MKHLLPLLLGAILHTGLWASTVPLANFDVPHSKDVQFQTEPDVADHDGDGDREGLIRTRGKSAVLRIKVGRKPDAYDQFRTHPLLRVAVRPDGQSRTSKSVKLHVVVQGENSFDKVEQFQITPSASGRMQELTIDLSSLRIGENGPTVIERIKSFTESEEKFLFIALHQFDKGVADADLVYDDLALVSADEPGGRTGPR